jgi:NADH:flavin oxidoreductase / NADH oxidase family
MEVVVRLAVTTTRVTAIVHGGGAGGRGGREGGGLGSGEQDPFSAFGVLHSHHSALTVGALNCKNRVVMAPLTRSRAGAGNVPHVLNALYYAQRASAGLIISEATQISPDGQGYISTPGIHSPEQIERLANRDQGCTYRRWPHDLAFQPGGALPVAPSAIKPNAQASPATKLLVAIANGPRDNEQAKARIKELLDNVLGQRFSVAQKLRDQLRVVCNDVENVSAKAFLDELIEWLAAKHLRD